jgi:plasmid stabilization system protein ParE
MNLIRRPIFLSDIEECADYLFEEAGEEVARRWKASLAETLLLISQHPEIGRTRADLPIPNVRTFHLREFPRYVVFYRIEAEQIELLRVRHGMMHLPGLFEGKG